MASGGAVHPRRVAFRQLQIYEMGANLVAWLAYGALDDPPEQVADPAYAVPELPSGLHTRARPAPIAST